MTTITAPDFTTAAITIEKDLGDARAMGFQFTPHYMLGQNAGSRTTEGYLRVRKGHEEKPLAIAPDGLPATARVIAAEDRRDYDISLRDSVIEPDTEGPMLITPHGDFRLEEGVFDDLCGFVPGRYVAGHYKSMLRIGERELTAHALNRLMGRAEDRDKPLRLRTRIPEAGAQRGAYAIVSGDYQAHNADAVAMDLCDHLTRAGFKGARVEFDYDGSLAEWKLTWFNYHGAAGAKAAGHGDNFMFGVRVRTADDRSSAVNVALTAFFNGCLNYIIIDESVVDLGSARHVGRLSIRSRLGNLINNALTQARPMAERWEAGSQENILAEVGAGDPDGAFKALMKRGYGAPPSGVTEAQMVARYTAALRNPAPGQTRWDGGILNRQHVINAMTQGAHASRWVNPWETSRIEADAGRLLYAKLAR